MWRRVLSSLHRYTGVALALFLLLVALTGSALVWKDSLDAWLNPALFRAPTPQRPLLSERELEYSLTRSNPGVRVVELVMPARYGDSALARVRGWPHDANPEQRRSNEIFLDPASGAILGTRSTRNPQFTRAEFVHWLRLFHFTLSLKRPGMVFMGIVSSVWLITCFVGIALTLPQGVRRWRKWFAAWGVRRVRLNYDIHRATGLWLQPMMIVLAASGIYLNLPQELFVPGVEAMTGLLPAGTGETVRDTVLESMHPLHTGREMGTLWHVLLFTTGLVMVALIVTGIRSTVRRWFRV